MTTKEGQLVKEMFERAREQAIFKEKTDKMIKEIMERQLFNEILTELNIHYISKYSDWEDDFLTECKEVKE